MSLFRVSMESCAHSVDNAHVISWLDNCKPTTEVTTVLYPLFWDILISFKYRLESARMRIFEQLILLFLVNFLLLHLECWGFTGYLSNIACFDAHTDELSAFLSLCVEQ